MELALQNIFPNGICIRDFLNIFLTVTSKLLPNSVMKFVVNISLKLAYLTIVLIYLTLVEGAFYMIYSGTDDIFIC